MTQIDQSYYFCALQMDNDYRYRQQKGYQRIQQARSITMAIILLSMSFLMFAADKINLEQIMGMDKIFRYFFGFICLLYGSFRLYRGIKNTY